MLITEFMEGGDLYHAIAQDSIGRFAWYRRSVCSFCTGLRACHSWFHAASVPTFVRIIPVFMQLIYRLLVVTCCSDCTCVSAHVCNARLKVPHLVQSFVCISSTSSCFACIHVHLLLCDSIL